MTRKGRNYSPEFKAKMALTAATIFSSGSHSGKDKSEEAINFMQR